MISGPDQDATTPDSWGAGFQPPPPEALEPFPEYPFHQRCERSVPLSLADAAGIALDFTHQCMTCRYKVGSVVGQEVFEREQSPYRFIVWQDVSKQILPHIHVKSSSFAEVRLFGSLTGERFLIDTKSLDKEHARQKSARYHRRSAPAFSVLHSRWTLQRQPAGAGGGASVHITLEAGGRTAGIAKLVPKAILRHELRHVILESLEFYDVPG